MFCNDSTRQFALLRQPGDWNIASASLALAGEIGDHAGIFGVDARTGEMRRASREDGVRAFETVPSLDHQILPGSMIAAAHRVIGLTTAGALFNTYGIRQFGLIK